MISRDIAHVDETPVQVLKENGRKPQSKSYMWVYRTGTSKACS
ncbi:MAG: IS66 family transposase [Anaerovoracaceae bacterium]